MIKVNHSSKNILELNYLPKTFNNLHILQSLYFHRIAKLIIKFSLHSRFDIELKLGPIIELSHYRNVSIYCASKQRNLKYKRQR